MRLSDVPKVQSILPQLEEAKRKLRAAQDLKKLEVLHGIGRELADYDAPSNIGAAFRKIKAALIELHEKELAGIEGALRAFGVDLE